MTKGFLYIANNQKFLDEALISARSLKRFNPEPVCLVCGPELRNSPDLKSFDKVVVVEDLDKYTYWAKIIGLENTPFEKTIFFDSDTFITDSLSEVFEVLDLVDLAATSQPTMHTTNFKELSYKFVFPELNSGVIGFRNNEIFKQVLKDWKDFCFSNNIKNDMPGLREGVIKNIDKVKYTILPDLYNEHGFRSMTILNGKIKVLHVRLGYQRGITTAHFLDFEAMDRFANMINKSHFKRLYISGLGIIPYNWNGTSLKLKLKKLMGQKRVSKHRQ